MRMSSSRTARLTPEQAEGIAAEAFAFLAGEPARFMAFLAATGLDLEAVREQVASREFLSAVLDHVARDEALLLVFAVQAEYAPEKVALAAQMLTGESFQ